MTTIFASAFSIAIAISNSRSMKRLPGFAVMLVIGLSGNQTRAATILNFTSSSQSWVGKGATRSITPSDGHNFYAETTHENTSGLLFRIETSTLSDHWSLSLAGPNFTRPVVGYYPNALRFLQQTTQPGLQFSGNGAADNVLSGEFTVLEAVFNSAGVPTAYAVDFLQYDEKNPSQVVKGSFRFNSAIPMPEPSTLLLIVVGLLTLPTRRRKSISHNRV